MAIDKSKRNRNAGKSPSYEKRGMSKEAIKKKRAYDTAYHKTRVADRVDRNKNRKEQMKKGKAKVGDKKDYDHATGKMEKRSVNRGRNSKNGGTSGDKRARG